VSTGQREQSPAREAMGEGVLDAVALAVESGAGLPAIARAAAKALGASLALVDRSAAVIAVAAASPSDEQSLLAGGDGVQGLELRVAEEAVGQMLYRGRDGSEPEPATVRILATVLALELERSRSLEWASEEAVGDFVRAVLGREVSGREDITARASELGADLGEGVGVVIARVHPGAAQEAGWRARLLTLAIRGARAASRGALAGELGGEIAEIAAIVPAASEQALARAAEAIERELREGLTGATVSIGRSRWITDPAHLHRAGSEARLAVNVGEAGGVTMLAFEDTGSYRLLLGTMSDDPAELESFYAETIAPLVAYDEQYETDLLTTVEAFLESDGNVAATAQRLFTHRHTVRYRLDRVRELSSHDITSTEGRERLSLGLKAMRVLGIHSPRGPAQEPGSEGGKVFK